MKNLATLLVTLTFGVLSVTAQESQKELASAAANPLADLVSLPIQDNLNMNYGDHDRNMNILNIQPVIPLANGKIITRTIFPTCQYS